MTTWKPDGVAIIKRKSAEVDCVDGPVRARVNASRTRVVVDLSDASLQPRLAQAAGYRLAAHVLEHVASAEGWCIADPAVRVRGGVRVVVRGSHAASVVSSFFGGAADSVLAA